MNDGRRDAMFRWPMLLLVLVVMLVPVQSALACPN
jgi:hypothetical protein